MKLAGEFYELNSWLHFDWIIQNKLNDDYGNTGREEFMCPRQRYTYRVLQTIQMEVILLWVWAEGAVLGRAKTALKFKYEI